ncbi:condensation domain-containing protein [Herbidospora mongoliensis]|uniref:condensation domain-containing protein n=1 Tax=Herbidospora mongoliensis TaxID=688067 RepID=UPI00083762C9|nr:condensation domain-containing protein [Herbidospora mongoliensis]
MKIEFTGADAGEAPLTWGQRLMWRAVYLMGPSQTFLNCPFVFPVYGRRELPAVLDALRVLIERHETLRTTFFAEGQLVARDGVLEVELVEAGTERGLQVAERVAAQLAHTIFDHSNELPLRCAVVVKGGRPVALACVFTHLAVDYHALAVLADEWRALLRGLPLTPVPWQPRDQAGLEATARWQARSARSIAYWRDMLDEAPLDVFDHAPGEPEDPRFIEVGMESTALAVAALRLADRFKVSTTSVLLAACATALAQVSARSRVVMQLVHSNRRDARTWEMVGTVGQDALVSLDSFKRDFGEVCQATHRAALQAYRNANYDPFAMTLMRQEVGARRGGEHDLDAFFNDRRPSAGWPALSPDADLSVSGTRTYTDNAWPGVRFKAFFTVGTAIETGQLSLIADTAYLSRERAESMLRGVEALLVGSV